MQAQSTDDDTRQAPTYFDLALERRQLLEDHPPNFQHPYKRMLYQLSDLPARLDASPLRLARYRRARGIAANADHRAAVRARPGFYDYAVAPEHAAGRLDWHVNFADGDLFFAYGSSLFAQDEMQVAEHPLLGSVREYLFERSFKDSDYDPCTRDDDNRPSPVLIRGVERCLHIDTAPDASRGRREGLYGNRFAQAGEATIRAATRVIDPPTLTNLIAMEAPKPGRGRYQPATIADILETAYTAFGAAVSLGGGACATVIHTGNWGCGAYGGNRTLMLAAQLLMADWAGAAEVLLYDAKESALAAALALRDRMQRERMSFQAAVAFLAEQRFDWGVSDGN